MENETQNTEGVEVTNEPPVVAMSEDFAMDESLLPPLDAVTDDKSPKARGYVLSAGDVVPKNATAFVIEHTELIRRLHYPAPDSNGKVNKKKKVVTLEGFDFFLPVKGRPGVYLQFNKAYPTLHCTGVRR